MPSAWGYVRKHNVCFAFFMKLLLMLGKTEFTRHTRSPKLPTSTRAATTVTKFHGSLN